LKNSTISLILISASILVFSFFASKEYVYSQISDNKVLINELHAKYLHNKVEIYKLQQEHSRLIFNAFDFNNSDISCINRFGDYVLLDKTWFKDSIPIYGSYQPGFVTEFDLPIPTSACNIIID